MSEFMYHQPDTPAAPAVQAPPNRARRTRTVLVAAAATLAAVLLGTLIGSAAVDVTASEEYRALRGSYDESEETRAGLVEENGELARANDDLAAVNEALEAENAELSVPVAALEERSAALDSRAEDLDGREAALVTREAEAAAREEAVTAREAAVTATEDQIAQNTFGNGVWTVGTDIAAGTYRVTEAVSSDLCYWGIYTTGSNQSDIIDNAIVTGGFPQVTLRAGQDFESSRCGTWTLQP